MLNYDLINQIDRRYSIWHSSGEEDFRALLIRTLQTSKIPFHLIKDYTDRIYVVASRRRRCLVTAVSSQRKNLPT